jgi:hypothetical protein
MRIHDLDRHNKIFRRMNRVHYKSRGIFPVSG